MTRKEIKPSSSYLHFYIEYTTLTFERIVNICAPHKKIQTYIYRLSLAEMLREGLLFLWKVSKNILTSPKTGQGKPSIQKKGFSFLLEG